MNKLILHSDYTPIYGGRQVVISFDYEAHVPEDDPVVLLCEEMEDLFDQFVQRLKIKGEISAENIFIDGTKIEAYANRYTFVWRKSVEKNRDKLLLKIAALMERKNV